MKILFVNEKCGYFGGVEQNIADAAEGLRARGHQCYLAYGTVTERDVDKYKSLFDGCFHCAELRDQGQRASGHHRSAVYAFGVILNHVAPDVVYVHKVADTRFYEPFFSQVRTVRMVHDHDLCCPRRHKYFLLSGRICHYKAGWRCWADGAFLAKTNGGPAGLTLVSIGRRLQEMRRNYHFDALLVGSRFMQEELLQNGFPKEKVHILPPVVRLNCERPSAVPSDPHLLYVGQLIRGKGVDLLLGALRQVSCDFVATIVGTGNAQDKLHALCQQWGLADRVRFRGWVNHEELKPLYAAAKVVVVPSRWPEPFGMIGLEAMHHGRAVVAFDVGGISDWLEHEVTGLLVPEQDVTGLARALERVLTDTELANRLGRNAYDRARTIYVFDRYIDTLEIYLSGRKPE